MILFVCQNETTKRAIQGCLKDFAQTTLPRRIAFADGEEWKRSPSMASVTIRSGSIRLGEVCAKVGTAKAA